LESRADGVKVETGGNVLNRTELIIYPREEKMRNSIRGGVTNRTDSGPDTGKYNGYQEGQGLKRRRGF